MGISSLEDGVMDISSLEDGVMDTSPLENGVVGNGNTGGSCSEIIIESLANYYN